MPLDSITSFLDRNISFLSGKLSTARHWVWYILLLTIVLSEMVTLAMNCINSMLWWGRIDKDLLLIGSIDAFVAAVFVGGIVVFLIRHAFNMENVNRRLKEEMEERVRMEHERSILEENLQQSKKMESLGILAGGVAHDLNNILGALVGYPDLLVLQLPADSPLIKPLLAIKTSGERAAAVVQDLLSLARRGIHTASVLNPNDMINDFIRSIEFSRIRDLYPQVHLETCLGNNIRNINGSPPHLLKALNNLVTNAFESIEGIGDIKISTENISVKSELNEYETIPPGDYAIITVADTGDGIPSDHLRKIFEPFFTQKVMGRSGSGLGLAVVWGTVKDHGGFIDVKSVPHKGSCFRLFIPASQDDVRPKDLSDQIVELYGKGETILIVDDVQEQRDLASQILTHLGYKTITSVTGQDALNYLTVNKVDLVLLDMIMDPVMDGLDTYKRIREICPDQKTIIVSGFSQSHRVKEALAHGVSVYVQKPYIPSHLARVIRSTLDGRL